MNKKSLPYLILFCALGLAATAGYYSIIGLSLLFAGVALPVMIMGTFLEISKLTIATLLHSYWKDLGFLMKTYLTIAVIVLSFITSIGIYGLLSSGYQSTERKDTVIQNEIKLIEANIDTYKQNKIDYKSELRQNQKDATQLRTSLGNNVQSRVDKDGNVITTSSWRNRKAYQEQLKIINENESILNAKIIIADSLLIKETKHKLLVESDSEVAAELGPLTYISKLVMKDRGTIINWLILCIIFVFDPLAISLIVAANFAFNKVRKTPKVYPPKKFKIYSPENKTEEEKLIPNKDIPDANNVGEKVADDQDEEEEEKIGEPEVEPTPPNPTPEEQKIQKQIQEVQNSDVASRNKYVAIEGLKNRLNDLRKNRDEDNTITY